MQIEMFQQQRRFLESNQCLSTCTGPAFVGAGGRGSSESASPPPGSHRPSRPSPGRVAAPPLPAPPRPHPGAPGAPGGLRRRRCRLPCSPCYFCSKRRSIAPTEALPGQLKTRRRTAKGPACRVRLEKTRPAASFCGKGRYPKVAEERRQTRDALAPVLILVAADRQEGTLTSNCGL